MDPTFECQSLDSVQINLIIKLRVLMKIDEIKKKKRFI